MDASDDEGPPRPSASSTPHAISDEALLSECRVDTFRSGGKGGQHQNTTDSGVRLTHLPTGIIVLSRNERSQYRNRKIALERLRLKLEDRLKVRKKRVATHVPPAERRRRLAEKRARAKKKDARRPPPSED